VSKKQEGYGRRLAAVLEDRLQGGQGLLWRVDPLHGLDERREARRESCQSLREEEALDHAPILEFP